ncbi:hypothetical protein [Bdellovibrio bacteriovorus]|uniref:hypothetical protein n=1 Tax=Bdellovibrio bacteriovorus TaxID=959 RepID=UPI0035A60129
MALSLSDETWAYWIHLPSWSHLEAALIVDGIIPSEKYFSELQEELHENSIGKFSTRVNREPTTEIFLKLIKRRFESKKVDPTECLLWCVQVGIGLDKKLTSEAIKHKLIPSKKMQLNSEDENNDSKSGRHWIEMRNNILIRALNIINDPPEGYPIFHKSSGKINITKLSTAVFEFGHELRYKKGGSIAFDTIYDTLKEAIKPSGKSKKTGK